MTPEVMGTLQAHDWSGNVRELANVMEHAFIIAGGAPITPEHLPHLVRRTEPVLSVAPGTSARPMQAMETMGPAPARTLDEIEMEHVLRVLEKHGGSKTAAAAGFRPCPTAARTRSRARCARSRST